MAKNYDVRVTNYKVTGCVPQIELSVFNAETQELERTFWLSAFRWYCFQVSGDDNGNCDYGATPVFGLETFGSIEQRGRSNLNTEETTKFFIEAAANHAIMEFLCRGTAYKYFHFEKPNYNSIFQINDYWNNFVDAVYGYATNGTYPTSDIED